MTDAVKALLDAAREAAERASGPDGTGACLVSRDVLDALRDAIAAVEGAQPSAVWGPCKRRWAPSGAETAVLPDGRELEVAARLLSVWGWYVYSDSRLDVEPLARGTAPTLDAAKAAAERAAGVRR